jgi:glycosyltransferase involved in cell wall biosynthesis
VILHSSVGRMHKLKILYITDFYYTVSSGAKTSARAHLKTLQNLYGKESVLVVALVGKNIPSVTEKEHIIIHGTHNKGVLLWNCLCGYSTYINKSAVKEILELIKGRNIDVVFVDNSIFGLLIKRIKTVYPYIPVLSYYHDVKAKLARDWMRNAPIYRKPIMYAMLSNEKLTAEYADVNFVLGDREEKLFVEVYGKKPEAQLSVYMDITLSNDFYIKKPNAKKKILFFGGYYRPNVHGIEWFIKNVYPQLMCETELIVAGHGMDKLNSDSYPNGVVVKGYVESIEEIYRDADIVISPIFEGGGMKVKVAEAMAFGKIVVGSDESYEGYQEKIPDNYWDKFFYRANTAVEFLSKIRQALKSSAAERHFNPEIRELYEKGFSEKYAENVISKMIGECTGDNR